jgi:exosortase
MIGGKNTWNSESIVLMGAVLSGVLVLYFPFLKTLVADWGVNEDYSHGYFIPFLSAYFIYTMREELSELQVQPSIWGLLLISLGFAQLLIGKVGSEYFLQRTSFILVILGVILFFLGWEFFKKLLFPILYLLFMVPLPAIIWNKIAFPMQLFASAITENVVYAIGIPIYREGNVLHLAETTLEVVAACSGLRSLMTMFALSGALAFLSILTTSRKWILFISAAPIAIVANILRLSGTALLASQFGSEVAHGFLHDFSGIVVFVIGLLMLMGVNSGLSKVGFRS